MLFWRTHLAHLHVPLSELLQHVFRAKRVIKLLLEVFNLTFRVGQFRLGQFELAYMVSL